MRLPKTRILPHWRTTRQYGTSKSNPRPPIIRITNGTFYRHHPSSHLPSSIKNPPLFQNLTFELPSFADPNQNWSIIGPSSSGKTTLLQILSGKHICIPPTARTYPYLESDEIEKKDHSLRNPERAIKRVGFDGEQGLGYQAPKAAYLSARYESRREDTDFSVLDYLQGNTELNASHGVDGKTLDPTILEGVIRDLRLGDLVDMPVSNLSNGQTRRARIARALLGKPEILLLDEPFMGLDPPTLLSLSPMLRRLAEKSEPRLALGLRPQDPIPEWITHLIYLKGNCEVAFEGEKEEVLSKMHDSPLIGEFKHDMHEIGRSLSENGISDAWRPTAAYTIPSPGSEALSSTAQSKPVSRDGYRLNDEQTSEIGEALVEMEGVSISYGSKQILGHWKQYVDGQPRDGLWWNVKRGERWGIFGPNGSGKTTILSLICSDHPQTYSLPIRLFGRSRLPEPGQRGISIFDIQAKIGHSSPEIHGHIPRSLTLRQTLENAWSDTFRGVPKLTLDANDRIDACLRWFEQDLRPGAGNSSSSTSSEVLPGKIAERPVWAEEVLFGGLPFSAQRVALFLRAIVKQPDLVILDEAFSGMDDGVRDRCLVFLAHGETMRRGIHGNEVAVEESRLAKEGLITVRGLTKEQALICISHVREEIPGSIREWICLPEPNTGEPARFGRLDGPIQGDELRWNDIWGMSAKPPI